ncbi:MAG: hypothetical protein Q606_CBAC00005G0003 [Intestinibacter bartlettii DORA_8_9]|nr:MAG: hypothetical protein Q606_CBAC00005G0003 [Intestinibacter bartlettii DORA_8_9]
MQTKNEPRVTFVNELDINKLIKGLESILGKKYDVDIKITAIKKTDRKESFR